MMKPSMIMLDENNSGYHQQISGYQKKYRKPLEILLA